MSSANRSQKTVRTFDPNLYGTLGSTLETTERARQPVTVDASEWDTRVLNGLPVLGFATSHQKKRSMVFLSFAGAMNE